MATTYHPFNSALSDGQRQIKKKLQKAYASNTPVSLEVKSEQIGLGDEFLFTTTQINKIQKAKKLGLVIDFSQTQIKKLPSVGAASFQQCLV